MERDRENMITDKELLAICNFSNLRLEFADLGLIRNRITGEILSNHTIYSLLEKEVESIEKNDPGTRVFRKEKYKKGIMDRSLDLITEKKEELSKIAREVKSAIEKTQKMKSAAEYEQLITLEQNLKNLGVELKDSYNYKNDFDIKTDVEIAETAYENIVKIGLTLKDYLKKSGKIYSEIVKLNESESYTTDLTSKDVMVKDYWERNEENIQKVEKIIVEEKKRETEKKKELEIQNEKEKEEYLVIEKDLPEDTGYEPIYNDVLEIKRAAGMVYEYYEKYKLGNDEGKFLEEWEVVYGADGYEIIKDYLDYFKETSSKGLICQVESGDEVFIYRDEENSTRKIKKKIITLKNNSQDKNKRKLDFFNEILADESEIKIFEQYENEIKNLKLYKTREEIAADKRLKKVVEVTLNIIDVLSVLVPGAIDFMQNQGSNLIVKGAGFFKNAKYLMHGMASNVKISSGVSNLLINNLPSAKILSEAIQLYKNNPIGDFLFKVVETIKKDALETTMEQLKKTKINLMSFNFTKMGIEIGGNLSFATYYILKKIVESSDVTEDYKKEELRQIVSKMEETLNLPYKNVLNISDEGFGIVVLKNKRLKKIVVSFKNPSHGSEVRNNIVNERLLNEWMLIDLFDKYIIPKIFDMETLEKYEIVTTGYNFGSDLAHLYYYGETFFEINNIRSYKITDKMILNNLRIFSPLDLAELYKTDYSEYTVHLKSEINPINFGNAALILFGTLLGIKATAMYFAGTIAFKIFNFSFNIASTYTQKAKANFLYMKMCQYGFFKCQNFSECQKFHFAKCKAINEEIPFPEIKENWESILEEYTEDFLFKEGKENGIPKQIMKIRLKVKDFLTLMIDKTFFELDLSFYKYIDNILRTDSVCDKAPYKTDSYLEGKELEYAIKKAKIEFKNLLKNYPEKYAMDLSFYQTYFYELRDMENGLFELKKYSQTIKRYIFRDIEQGSLYSVAEVLEPSYEATNSSKVLIWLMKKIYFFNENMKKKLKEEIFLINRTTTGYKIKYHDNLNYLDEKFGSGNISNTDNEFLLFPYIESYSGNIEKRKNGDVTYLNINKNYIGSVFRSMMEEIFAIKAKIEPKFYNEEEALKEKLTFSKENWYKSYVGENNKGINIDKNLFTFQKGRKLNDYFHNYFNKYEEYVKSGYIFTTKGYRAFKDVLKRIEEIPEILEDFYILLDKKEGERKIKELRIGHIHPNGEHNEKEIGYIYNKDDSIKRGILLLNCTGFEKKEENAEGNADKETLVSGAVLKCNKGSSTSIFNPTTVTENKINGMAIGLSLDKKGEINIKKFGYCSVKDSACVCPDIIGNWTNTSKGVNTKRFKQLTTSSTIKCSKGGIIKVVSNKVKSGNIN